MAVDRLEKELIDIEKKLGGTGEQAPYNVDRLEWHLNKLEELAGGGGGGSGVADIKVDGQSIVSDGQANIITKTAYHPETNRLATEADVQGGGSIDTLVLPITYAELKELRDNNELTPGMNYRIIDYVATVNGSQDGGHQSAFNKFDIIVTATSTNTLSEDAKAAISADDKGHFTKITKTVVSADWVSGTTISDIEFKYKVGSSMDTYGEEEEGDTDTVIQTLSTKPNAQGVTVPAMLNPAPSSFQYTSSLVQVYYTEFSDEIQYEGRGTNKQYVFVEKYIHNGDGFTNAPAMYKTDPSKGYSLDDPDYDKSYVYVSDMTVDGVRYNYWRAIEDGDLTDVYIYTNIIVENGAFKAGITNDSLTAAVSVQYVPSENDVWYIYAGTITIDGEEQDLWQEYDEYNDEFLEYYHTTNHLVEAEIVTSVEPIAKLESWELKYHLDNDNDRFNWASNCMGHTAVVAEFEGSSYIYVRYPAGDTEDQLCWVYVSNTDGYDLNDGGSFDWDDFDNTDFFMTGKVVNVGDKVETSSEDIYTIIDVSGRGVVYYLKDEWGNEAGFDFKGILIYGEPYSGYGFYYLFSSSITYPEKKDISLLGCCVNNKICITDEWDWDEGVSYTIYIPSVICAGPSDDSCCCQDNIIGKNCSTILLQFQGGNTSRNTIGNYCSNITLVGCQDNIIGTDCSSITINQNSRRNTIGKNCYQITLSSGCLYNTIGDDVRSSIWFGTNCKYNQIGSKGSNIALGNYNENNTFGTSCSFIQLGNYCFDWIFDNDCTTITFASTPNYVKGFKFEGVCSNFMIIITGNATSSNYAQDKVFHSIRCGSGSSYGVTVNRDNKYQIDYYWENNRFVEVASHKASKIYKHNVKLELEGSSGDKRLFLTIFNNSNETITVGEVLDYIGEEWLTNTLVHYCDDVSAKYTTFAVEDYWNYEPQGEWHGWVIAGHGAGSGQQWEVTIDDQNGTTVMSDYIQEL